MPGTPHHSPTVRRRRLAAELRRLREASGKTHEDVAAELGWHRSKIGRIEGAQFVRLSLTDLRALLDLYGVAGTDQREALITLGKEGRERGWWHSYADVLPNPHSVLIGLEAEALSVRAYQAQLVPGLLQTEDYTRAILRGSSPGTTGVAQPGTAGLAVGSGGRGCATASCRRAGRDDGPASAAD